MPRIRTSTKEFKNRKTENEIIGSVFGYLTAIEKFKDGNKTKWRFSCICGNLVESRLSTIQGRPAPSCGCKHKKITWTTPKYNKAVVTKYPNIICVDEYVGISLPLKHLCSVHGTFYSSATVMLNKAVKYGCPDCAYENKKQTRTYTETKVHNKITEIHGNKVVLNEAYKGNFEKVHDFICDKSHTWRASPKNVIVNLSGCPRCCNSRGFSKMEKHWIRLMKTKINPNILTSDDKPLRITLKGFKRAIRPDGYDPATKTVYEFHGDYWHGNLANNKKYHIGSMSRHELNKRTRKREKALLKAGYKVIYCWESDFKKYLKRKFYFCAVPFTQARLSKSPYCH